MLPLDEMGALDEHPARTASGIQHSAALGFKHIGNQRDQRNGRKKLSAVVGLLVSKLRQEVLIDTAEDIARDMLEFVGIQRAKKLAQNAVI